MNQYKMQNPVLTEELGSLLIKQMSIKKVEKPEFRDGKVPSRKQVEIVVIDKPIPHRQPRRSKRKYKKLTTLPSYETCSCGKLIFNSASEASSYVKKMKIKGKHHRGKIQIYKCHVESGKFHFGHSKG